MVGVHLLLTDSGWPTVPWKGWFSLRCQQHVGAFRVHGAKNRCNGFSFSDTLTPPPGYALEIPYLLGVITITKGGIQW
jgi:hypothetical protein